MTQPLAQPHVDFCYASAALAGDEAAIFYWGRTRHQPTLPELTLLDFEVTQAVPQVWQDALDRLVEVSRERRARYPHIGVICEDLALARTLAGRGLRVHPVPDHLAKPDAWEHLWHTAAVYVRARDVAWSAAALERARTTTPCPARTFRGGPRVEGDATTPAYLLGIVLGLDEPSATPPRPARVKVIQGNRSR